MSSYGGGVLSTQPGVESVSTVRAETGSILVTALSSALCSVLSGMFVGRQMDRLAQFNLENNCQAWAQQKRGLPRTGAQLTCAADVEEGSRKGL